MSIWTSYGSASLSCQLSKTKRCLTKAPLWGFFFARRREEHRQKAEIATRDNMKNKCGRETGIGPLTTVSHEIH